MRFKVLTLLAAASLLAACSSAPEDEPATNTAGNEAAPTAPPAPPATVPLSIDQEFAMIGDSVFFAFDKSSLSSDAQAVLDEQAQFLRSFPAVTVMVEGHADERGTDDYNLALSARRAAAARDYLIAKGVAAARIETLPLGESRPFATGSNENAWAQNRRALTVLTGGLDS